MFPTIRCVQLFKAISKESSQSKSPLCRAPIRPAHGKMRARAPIVIGIFLLLMGADWAFNQAPTGGRDPSYDTPRIGPNSNAAAIPPLYDPAEQQRELQALNAERHKSMTSNAKKMVEIAQALDDEVSKKNPDSLTPDELSKVAQIQKLARNIKSAMSSTARNPSVIPTAPAPIPAPSR